jgi:hypothetical protein
VGVKVEAAPGVDSDVFLTDVSSLEAIVLDD